MFHRINTKPSLSNFYPASVALTSSHLICFPMKQHAYNSQFRKEVIFIHSILPTWSSFCFFCILAITSFFCDLAPQLGAWNAAVYLHNSLLSAVFHLPLVFFDVTPIGRVLARFSKDIDVLDNTLPMTVSELVYCFYEVTRVYSADFGSCSCFRVGLLSLLFI